MANRFKKINDPDGNEIDFYQERYRSAYIEKLDGRNPLFKYYKYRFCITGGDLSTKFLRWMHENFGPSTSHGLAIHYVKCNVNLDTVPWVHQINDKSYRHRCQIYFNKDCEVLIRLKFTNGATL